MRLKLKKRREHENASCFVSMFAPLRISTHDSSNNEIQNIAFIRIATLFLLTQTAPNVASLPSYLTTQSMLYRDFFLVATQSALATGSRPSALSMCMP